MNLENARNNAFKLLEGSNPCSTCAQSDFGELARDLKLLKSSINELPNYGSFIVDDLKNIDSKIKNFPSFIEIIQIN
ncbi:hypothetical protein AKO1_007094, partial [Acrasis kona]